jgi:hypothetical protein
MIVTRPRFESLTANNYRGTGKSPFWISMKQQQPIMNDITACAKGLSYRQLEVIIQIDLKREIKRTTTRVLQDAVVK